MAFDPTTAIPDEPKGTAFDPSTAVPVGEAQGFDPNTATPEKSGGLISDMATGLAIGSQKIPGMLAGFADLPSALITGGRPISALAEKAGEITGFQPGKRAEDLRSTGYSDERAAGQQAMDTAWAPFNALSSNPDAGVVDYARAIKEHGPGVISALVDNPRYTATQIAESLPGMGVGGVASKIIGPALQPLGKWAAPVAGGIGEGAVQAGSAMDELGDATDQRKAAIAALTSGATNAVLAAGGGRLANKIGLETPETLLAKLGSEPLERAGALPLRVAGGAVSEGLLQELPQGMQEQAWMNYAEGKPLMEGVVRSGFEGAVAGGVLGGAANMTTSIPAKPPGLLERAARGMPDDVPAAPVASVDGGVVQEPPAMTAEELVKSTSARANELNAKLEAAKKGDLSAGLVTPDERAELDFLTQAGQDPNVLAQGYGIALTTKEERKAAEKAAQEPASADPEIAEQESLIDELNRRIPEQPEAPQFSRETPNDDGAHMAAQSPLNDLSEPTQAQKDAGNYTKGRANVSGLEISVENPQGSERKSAPDAAEQWSVTMQDHYGYFKGVPARAADKDHVDTFVKAGTPKEFEGDVFIVNQNDQKTGEFDEPKVMVGYESMEEAQQAYMRNFTPGWKGFGDIVQVPMAELKTMLQDEKLFQSPIVARSLPENAAPTFFRDVQAEYRKAKDTVEFSPMKMDEKSVGLEKAAHDRVTEQGDQMVEEYVQRFGKIIDADNAKRMFSDFELNPSLAGAFHEPSSRLSKMVYAKLLEENVGQPVVFTAGGGGSGKTEAFTRVADAIPQITGSIINDSTLSSFKSAKSKIDLALKSGAPVRIVYTNREVGLAFDGAMGRKRVVPIDAIASAHVGASKTIREIAKHYAGNDQVEIVVVNNNGDLSEISVDGKLDDIPVYDQNEVKERLNGQARNALQAGRITDQTYRTLVGVQGATAGGVRKAEAAGQDDRGPGARGRSEGLPEGEVGPKFLRKLPSFKRNEKGVRSPLETAFDAKDIRARLSRKAKREAMVGVPKSNRRIEFKPAEGSPLVVGMPTFDDWIAKVKNFLTTEQFKDARVWYRQLHDFLTPIYGDDAPKFALAWLLSQKNESPSGGLRNVLRAENIAQGKQKIKTAGLNEAALIQALTGQDITVGVGAKLSDFVDSELGLNTRTWMGRKKAGRQPAAIDVWAYRDIGFVDEAYYNFLVKKFGQKAVDESGLQKDVAFGETQYEYGIDYYNDLVDHLNKIKYDGGKWTAREVQAVGWVAQQYAMEVEAEFVSDIVGANTRRVSIGLKAGTGTPMEAFLHNNEMSTEEAHEIIKEIADVAGVKILNEEVGAGAYLTDLEGAIQVDAFASPESIEDFIDMLGYALQQTSVIATRPLKSGKNHAIDIFSADLADITKASEWFEAFVAAQGDKVIAPGFQQILGDTPGIRLLNFDGHWGHAKVERLLDAAEKAAKQTGVTITETTNAHVEFKESSNDWTQERQGEKFLESLASRGRVQEAGWLASRYPPSRFDIAETPGFSRRSNAASSGRSGEGRPGVGYGTAQEGSTQVAGVHYSTQSRDFLSSRAYGSGMAGAESRRLNDSWTATPEQKKRIYWYVDEGSGIAPESGVGRSPHNVTLNNVYDWYKDPLNLKEKVLAKRPVTENDAFNFYEQEIMAAGFDGYYMRGAQNIVVDGQQKKQGVAVLLGEHTVRLRGPKFQRAEARATATAPETKQSKAVSILNQGMARYFKDNQWENAYAPGELHDTLSEIGEALEVGFGTRVIPVRPTSAKFDIFNGVHYGGNVYVNTQATVGFVNIAGHELFHELKKKRPDLYKWFADQSRQYLKDFDAYQAKLNALLQVGEKPYDTATAEEELLSDFTGDSLADPAFLQQLADASQTKFRQLLMAIRSWIDGAIAKLKGNKSERYVTDLQAMRDNLSKALVAFAEGKPIASTERVDISSLKLDEGGVSIARATWFWDAKYVHTNTKPINVDRTTNEVLDGYHRIEQAKRNGETTIEVEYVDRAAPEMSRATAGGAFYSPLERAFSGAKMTAMTGEGWASWLKANQSKLGLKADEIEWSGINEYLSLRGKEKISREDVASYLGENGVKVNSVTKRDNEDGLAEDDIYVERRIVGNGPDVWQVFRGTEVVEEFNDDDFAAANDLQEKLQKEVRDGTKYAGYIPPGSLPGSYREILVTLPAKADKIERPQVVDKGVDENGRAQFDVVRDGNVLLSFQNWAEATDFAYETYQYAKMAETKARPGFTSNHWDEPNVLAHVRLDEVETAEGRALRVIEVQSDFGQEYKRQRDAIKAAVDADFQGIVNRMTAAGVLEVVC